MVTGIKRRTFYKLEESRWVFELIFCVAVYFILLNMFSGSSETRMIDHIYTSIFLGTLIMAGTVNSWVIRKRFLAPGRFWIFLVLSLINILIWTLFNQLLFERLIDFILPGYYFISYYDYGDLFKFFLVYVTLITLLDLSWEWFQLQETRHRLVVVEKEKINAELKALTNQVNPHFLFNSLTVLYSLALQKSSETAGAIIKLSDILRYVIYESGRGEVPLGSEIALIRNYIDLQRFRIAGDAAVNLTTDVDDENIPVISMLFLPLVENSFKHGIKGDVTHTFVDIDLRTAGGSIFFTIRNNRGPGVPTDGSTGGIGLKNIRERLRLCYPDRHSLSVSENAKEFMVKLKIDVL